MLSQIENGKSNPTVSTLWKISTALKVSFSIFYWRGGRGANYSWWKEYISYSRKQQSYETISYISIW